MWFVIKQTYNLGYKIEVIIKIFARLMTKKAAFNYIKTPCGQAKYIELESNKTLLGKFRLIWFILIASIRDWNIKD